MDPVKKGFGFIMMVRFESLPKVVPLNYMHKYCIDTKAHTKAESYM